MDIRFYSMDLVLKHILPNRSKNKACLSSNARFDFNGDGYFELDFKDTELQALLTAEPDLLIVWGEFQGFVTGYNFTGKKKKIFGMHLNGLLSHEVVDDLTEPVAADAETLIYDKITEIQSAGRLSWLNLKPVKGIFNKTVEFFKNACVTANKWVQELLALDNAGYKISADLTERKFYFELLSRRESTLIVSESLKNAYDITIDYNSKKTATGGFYKNDTDTWQYVQLSEADGISRRDTILSATNEADARRELEASRSAVTVSALTRRIAFGADYILGDIIRMQTECGMSRKFIKSVLVSSEGASYIESPEFEEVT